MKTTFDEIIEIVLKHEGGYTNDKDDPGNWTGGKVGEGILKGTNFGIAANSYPELDIKNLTVDQAKAVYYSDYWKRGHCDKIPEEIRQIYFDSCINHGRGGAAKLLQRTIGVTPDGAIGPVTLSKVGKATLKGFAVQRLMYYTRIVARNQKMEKYLKGWFNRVYDLIK